VLEEKATNMKLRSALMMAIADCVERAPARSRKAARRLASSSAFSSKRPPPDHADLDVVFFMAFQYVLASMY
jgi:hypothetical protein